MFNATIRVNRGPLFVPSFWSRQLPLTLLQRRPGRPATQRSHFTVASAGPGALGRRLAVPCMSAPPVRSRLECVHESRLEETHGRPIAMRSNCLQPFIEEHSPDRAN